MGGRFFHPRRARFLSRRGFPWAMDSEQQEAASDVSQLEGQQQPQEPAQPVAAAAPSDGANHIYLMPFPRGEYDLYAEPVPPETEYERKMSDLEKQVEAMASSKKVLERIVGDTLGDFVLESALVKAAHNGREVVIHHPESMSPLDAYVRYEHTLSQLRKRNSAETLMTLGGGILGMFFGEFFIPLILAPYLAQGWRRKRAYEMLIERAEKALPMDDDGGCTTAGASAKKGKAAQVRFEADGTLQAVVDYLALPQGRLRRYKDLIAFCDADEELKGFAAFYKGKAA